MGFVENFIFFATAAKVAKIGSNLTKISLMT